MLPREENELLTRVGCVTQRARGRRFRIAAGCALARQGQLLHSLTAGLLRQH
jgi:hypothetical protein